MKNMSQEPRFNYIDKKTSLIEQLTMLALLQNLLFLQAR
jgi:hypothetical protein